MGFEPGAPPCPPPLRRVEAALRGFGPLYAALDSFVVMGALDLEYVYMWREQAHRVAAVCVCVCRGVQRSRPRAGRRRRRDARAARAR